MAPPSVVVFPLLSCRLARTTSAPVQKAQHRPDAATPVERRLAVVGHDRERASGSDKELGEQCIDHRSEPDARHVRIVHSPLEGVGRVWARPGEGPGTRSRSGRRQRPLAGQVAQSAAVEPSAATAATAATAARVAAGAATGATAGERARSAGGGGQGRRGKHGSPLVQTPGWRRRSLIERAAARCPRSRTLASRQLRAAMQAWRRQSTRIRASPRTAAHTPPPCRGRGSVLPVDPTTGTPRWRPCRSPTPR